MKAPTRVWNFGLTGVVLSICVGLTSCFDSNYDFNNISDEIELTPGVAVPLAYGSLTLEDILNEVDTGDFVKGFPEDSLLYIVYTKNLVSYNASEVIDIPDQDFLQIFIDSDVATASLLPVPPGETASFTKEKKGEFTFTNGEIIDSANVRTLRMLIDVNSSFHHTGQLIIYSNNVFVDGKPFSKAIQISSAAGNFSYSLDTALTNVKIILDNSNPDTTFLPLEFNLELINSGAPVLPSEKCNITMSFRQIKFSSIFGYLGEYNILVNNGQLDVSVFNETVQGGSLKFFDPRIALTVDNSYGIPVQINLTGTNVVSTINNGLVTPITFNGVNPFDIAAPDLAHFGESVHTDLPINKDNSNIKEAMETSPNHLNYTASAITNAQGRSGPYNFVTDSSTMDLGVEVVLPLWVKAEGFSLQDTVDFDFEKEVGTNTDMIDYFRLSLTTDNGIPVETKIQVYFLDINKVVIDSLFRDTDVFLDPAEVGADEKVTVPTHFVKQVEYNQTQLTAIKPTKFAVVKASVNTPAIGTKYFKFYSFYGIDFKLSAKADLRVNPKNF